MVLSNGNTFGNLDSTLVGRPAAGMCGVSATTSRITKPSPYTIAA